MKEAWLRGARVPSPRRDDLASNLVAPTAAVAWFVKVRWPNGIACHYCGSVRVQTGCKHKTMPFRCRDCRKWFSPRTGTVMQSSKLPRQDWAIAFYLGMTNLKGISSMKLRQELEITQKSAWHLAHRIRGGLIARAAAPMYGPVEADETYLGGRSKSMHASKRRQLTGRSGLDKEVVAGVKDRASGRVKAAVVESTDGPTLRGFVSENAADGAKVYLMAELRDAAFELAQLEECYQRRRKQISDLCRNLDRLEYRPDSDRIMTTGHVQDDLDWPGKAAMLETMKARATAQQVVAALKERIDNLGYGAVLR